jgi:UDP-3-O-[3-hydroxymyristoyl] glucosamine N-acyltransferase
VIGNIHRKVVIGDGAVIGRDVHIASHAVAPADCRLLGNA